MMMVNGLGKRIRTQIFTTAAGVLLLAGYAQAETPQQALDWAQGLRDRFSRSHAAPVATFASASLGAAVCKYDPSAGSRILQQSIASLNTLPARAFFETGPVLPVTSFTALTAHVLRSAAACDSNLGIHLASDSVRERLAMERLKVTEYINEARSLTQRNPDRSAQFLIAALSVGNPELFPFESLISVLAVLRVRAPDLADEVFESALDFAAQSQTFRFAHLTKAGEYLFTAPQLVEKPDEELLREEKRIGDLTLSNWRENRRSANPDPIDSYLMAIKRALEGGAAVQSPALAFAIVHQMLPRVRELAPSEEMLFQQSLAEMAAVPESRAAQIRAAFGGSDGAVHLEMSSAWRLDRLVVSFRQAWLAERVEEARNLQRSATDSLVSSQLNDLALWADIVRALKQKTVGLATGLMHPVAAGAKRVLLRSAIAAGRESGAAESLTLAWREAQSLPADHRAYVITPIAALALVHETEMGYTLVTDLVRTYNEASTRPRTRFDPGRLRRGFKISSDVVQDSSNLLLREGKGPLEVLDTGRRRHGFPLQAPGVNVFDLPSLIRSAPASLDLARLESILLDLRDETRRSLALVSLAELRLKFAKPEDRAR